MRNKDAQPATKSIEEGIQEWNLFCLEAFRKIAVKYKDGYKEERICHESAVSQAIQVLIASDEILQISVGKPEINFSVNVGDINPEELDYSMEIVWSK